MKPTADATRDREQTWREIMARWERTGLSQQEFCEREQIKLTTFGYWRRELKRRDSQGKSAKPLGTLASGIKDSSSTNTQAPLFVPIQVSQAPPASSWEIVLDDGLVIRIPSACDLEHLARLVRTLEAR
jgi:hypothetical protein